MDPPEPASTIQAALPHPVLQRPPTPTLAGAVSFGSMSRQGQTLEIRPFRTPFDQAIAMPYDTNEDLPDSVRGNLPGGAQTIYREAFNSAWDRYADHSDREATAHKIAWHAVKQSYEKRDDRWVKK